MSPLKKAFCLLLAVMILAACQQKKNTKQSLRNGRGLRGSTVMNTGPGSAAIAAQQCGSYSVVGKQWGEVTSYQGEQAFYQEVLMLTNPVLRTLPPDDQLGFVSGQSGQYTGVRFWGHAVTTFGNGNGPVDAKSAEIRIEIFDDRACQPKADGSVRPVIPIHIGASQPGFVGVEGYINGGVARLTFVDTYGAIILDGQISNNYFSGTMSYTLPETGGQPRILGRFAVPYCGFFSCY